MWLAHRRRNPLASSASGSQSSSLPELPSLFLGPQARHPRDVTPSSTIAYAATMVKQSRSRALYLFLMRR
jgi:hypothetical protein